MRYIKERLGIDLNIDDQVNKYIEEIKSNPNKNEFDFIYANNYGNTSFKIRIVKDLDAFGRFQRDVTPDNWSNLENLEILLKDRESSSTLMHELKHLDHLIRKINSKKNIKSFKGIYNDEISDFHKILTDRIGRKKDAPSHNLIYIFYIFNIDELEARYHGLYKDMSNYLKDNPPKDIYDIGDAFEKILCYDEASESLRLLLNLKEFKFSDIFKEKFIRSAIYQYLIDDSFDAKDVITFLIRNYKTRFKTRFNTYSKKDLDRIDRIQKRFESVLTKRINKWNRKIFRLIFLLKEKHLEN